MNFEQNNYFYLFINLCTYSYKLSTTTPLPAKADQWVGKDHRCSPFRSQGVRGSFWLWGASPLFSGREGGFTRNQNKVLVGPKFRGVQILPNFVQKVVQLKKYQKPPKFAFDSLFHSEKYKYIVLIPPSRPHPRLHLWLKQIGGLG